MGSFAGHAEHAADFSLLPGGKFAQGTVGPGALGCAASSLPTHGPTLAEEEGVCHVEVAETLAGKSSLWVVPAPFLLHISTLRH